MKIIGPEAVAAYLKLCPNDTLDDLSEQDLAGQAPDSTECGDDRHD